MRVAWLTDIHLNFLELDELTEFMVFLSKYDADGFVISGDIAEGDTLVNYLSVMSEAIRKQIFFVLGNHDYYRSSFNEVRKAIAKLCRENSDLIWLPAVEYVVFSDDTAMVGHGAWADGRYGKYGSDRVLLSDHQLIKEFSETDKAGILKIMQELADEAAKHFRECLPEALEKFEHVYVVMHPAPFEEVCFYRGKLSDEEFLPHFSCKAVGDVLLELAEKYPDKKITVLSGHMHYQLEKDIRDNLKVLVGGAKYGSPAVQRVFDFK